MKIFEVLLVFIFFLNSCKINCAVQPILLRRNDEPLVLNYSNENSTQTKGVGLGVPPLFVHVQKLEEESTSPPWTQNSVNSIEPNIPNSLENNPCFTTNLNTAINPTTPSVDRVTTGLPLKDNNIQYGNCLKLRGIFPTNVCNKYINCWDGYAQEQTCPEGLLFNIAGYCDYPANVNCQGRILEDFPHKRVNILPQNSNYPQNVNTVDVNHQSNSSELFIKLENNQNSLVYEQLKLKCYQPRGQFPSESCHKYINCWDGLVTEEECPKGLLFSNKGYCDYPANVNCGLRTLPIVQYTNSECPQLNGVFRNRTNCRKYFSCGLNNVIARYECPEGLYFNEAIGVCDYPTNISC